MAAVAPAAGDVAQKRCGRTCRRAGGTRTLPHRTLPPHTLGRMLPQWHSEHLSQHGAAARCRPAGQRYAREQGCVGTWRGPCCGVVVALQVAAGGAGAALATAAGPPPVTHAVLRHSAAGPIRCSTPVLQNIDGWWQVRVTDDVLSFFGAINWQVSREWQASAGRSNGDQSAQSAKKCQSRPR